MQRKGSESNYRQVRDAVLDRDGHRCQDCGRFALTVRYVGGIVRRLNPADMVAVCGDCQIVTPADQSGDYQPKRRGRSDKGKRGGRRPARTKPVAA